MADLVAMTDQLERVAGRGGRPRPAALPTVPTEYHQLLRGPLHRWWSPLLALLVLVPLALALIFGALIPIVIIGAIRGVANPVQWTLMTTTQVNNLGPAGFLYVNLSLIALIPAAGLSIWIGHQVRPRYLSSVQGGIRWRWLLRCLLMVVPIWAMYVGISTVVAIPQGVRPQHWVLLLAMVVLLTPLQAAGEEYLFRGWILQNVGSWFARPLLGFLVSVVISTAAFAAAHTSTDPWIIGSLACLAVSSAVAAWRTGGMEAGIVLHAVNNVTALGMVIVFGGWQQAFITPTSRATPAVFVLALIVHGIALALILWQAKKIGLQRLSTPQPSPASMQYAPAISLPLPPEPLPSAPPNP
jgi:membrane protease YdiL (CAAX protease family)